jgi:hypothetical protein
MFLKYFIFCINSSTPPFLIGTFVRGAYVRGAFVRGAYVRAAFVRGAFVLFPVKIYNGTKTNKNRGEQIRKCV